jgi:hypothetical protein
MKLESVPLHDAVLTAIHMSWSERVCVLELSAFVAPGSHAVPCCLTFHGVSDLRVPHEESWGTSSSVNGGTAHGGVFKIEMQSGDVIEVKAHEFSFAAI